MLASKILYNPLLWCGYYLTLNQKRELIKQTILEFERPVNYRLRPFQLVEKVRNMIKN